MGHVYREKSLQLAAVDWMAREWGYDELAGDVEATGDRMDSIGLLAGEQATVGVHCQRDRRMSHHGLDALGVST